MMPFWGETLPGRLCASRKEAMTGVDIIYLVFSLACTILSASFASREIAFMNLQRIRLKHLQTSHVHSTDGVVKIIGHPD
jgi:Mg2+/Co2+ transporter CorB